MGPAQIWTNPSGGPTALPPGGLLCAPGPVPWVGSVPARIGTSPSRRPMALRDFWPWGAGLVPRMVEVPVLAVADPRSRVRVSRRKCCFLEMVSESVSRALARRRSGKAWRKNTLPATASPQPPLRPVAGVPWTGPQRAPRSRGTGWPAGPTAWARWPPWGETQGWKAQAQAVASGPPRTRAHRGRQSLWLRLCSLSHLPLSPCCSRPLRESPSCAGLRRLRARVPGPWPGRTAGWTGPTAPCRRGLRAVRPRAPQS